MYATHSNKHHAATLQVLGQYQPVDRGDATIPPPECLLQEQRSRAGKPVHPRD